VNAPAVHTRATPLALEPVRTALLDDAHREADDIVAAARAAAAESVAAAEHEADEALRQVRRRKEATARARAERAREDARRTANAELLRARDELHRQLAEAVHEAVHDLTRDPRYPALLDRLEQLAREQLGNAAEIERDPAGYGGVVATEGHRRVDYRLPALADRALATIADEVVATWS
jgi:vacuolar-type H+-ATPase subunit E/Vma4